MVSRFLTRHERVVLVVGVALGIAGIAAVALGEGLVGWVAATVAMVLLIGLQCARGGRLNLPDGWP